MNLVKVALISGDSLANPRTSSLSLIEFLLFIQNSDDIEPYVTLEWGSTKFVSTIKKGSNRLHSNIFSFLIFKFSTME
jgi:hypothetical protein